MCTNCDVIASFYERDLMRWHERLTIPEITFINLVLEPVKYLLFDLLAEVLTQEPIFRKSLSRILISSSTTKINVVQICFQRTRSVYCLKLHIFTQRLIQRQTNTCKQTTVIYGEIII